MKFLKRKRIVIPAIVGVIALVGGGAAYAFFTSTGSGNGSAQVGTAKALTITQVGAGYDSLIPSNTYSQDQCFACDGPQELGNEVTLSTPNAPELVSVVVAIDNWGPAETGVPMTISIPGSDTPGGATLSDTQDFNFAAQVNSDTPSETNITFNFASQAASVDSTFVYGITFNTAADEAPVPAADSLNVALSSSANDLSVGSDTNPGTIWMDDTFSNNNDFPTCMDSSLPTSGFEQVTTDCGVYSPGNPGAYGTPAEVTAGSADIPAVEVNVVGGVVPSLYPGGPSEPVDFAITNPGPSSVVVSTVTATVSSVTVVPANQSGGNEACSTTFYPIANSPVTLNATVPSGTTIESPSGMTISMTNDNKNQDNCEGATVNLSFTSP